MYNSPNLWQILDISNRHTLGGDKNLYVNPTDPTNVNFVLGKLLQSKPRAVISAENGDNIVPGSRSIKGEEEKLFDETANLHGTGSSTSATVKRPFVDIYNPPKSSSLIYVPEPYISRFIRITKLDLSCSAFDLATFSLPSIRDILSPTLTHLILSGCALVNSGSLYHLRNLPNLEFLNLSHCDAVDDMGLEALSFFANQLVGLNLSYLFKITEHGVRYLYRMPRLVSLNLMGCCKYVKNLLNIESPV
jgi:hypothetical protein